MAEVLVIEEHGPWRERLVHWLRCEGLDAVGAADGPTGVAMAIRLQPSVVLCDMALRKLNGIGVLCVLRNAETCNRSRIVMMMAENDRTLKAQVLRLGAHGTVSKPASFPALLQAVQAQLASTQA